MTWLLSMRSRPAKSVAAIPLLAFGQERTLGALNLIETPNYHPACSKIVAEQERCPWWVSRPKGLLRCGPAVTPPISVVLLWAVRVNCPQGVTELILRYVDTQSPRRYQECCPSLRTRQGLRR